MAKNTALKEKGGINVVEPPASPPPMRRAVVSAGKAHAQASRRPIRQAAPAGYDPRSMEHGIISLLSFLGHSYKSGKMSQDRYYEVADASLRKLEEVRQSPSYRRGGYDDESFDEGPAGSRYDKLEKNKADLEAMLSFLEDSYNEGSISAESYRELRHENLKRLSRITKLMGNDEIEGDESEIDSGPVQRVSRGRPQIEDEDEGEQLPARASRAPPASAPKMRVQSPALYDDLSESFDGNAVLEQTKDIMSQLNIGRDGGAGEQAQAQEQQPQDELAALDADLAQQQDHTGEAKVSSFLNKLSSIVPAGKPAVANASGGAAAASALANASNVPFIEGPGGTKMYGSGTEEDPYRPTPEKQAPVTTAPVAVEEKSPFADIAGGRGGDEGGLGSQATQKIVLELEKLKVRVDTVGEARNSLEERIGHIQESVGELRQMLFERDASAKEWEAKVARYMDMVEELEPAKLMKELEKRDRTIGEVSMRIEKQEAMGGDLAGKVNKTNEMLESIGSLKNISNVNKEIGEKLSRIEGTVNKTERLSEEIGRVYVDLNRRLEDFNLYRGKQDLMSESVKDLVQLVESVNAKAGEMATKDDLNEVRKALEDAKLKSSELDAKITLVEQGQDLPHALKELKRQKEGIETILSSNEQEFYEKLISREDYARVRQANLRKLAEAEARMREEFAHISSSAKAKGVQEARIEEGIRAAVTQSSAPMPQVAQTFLQPAQPRTAAPFSQQPPMQQPSVLSRQAAAQRQIPKAQSAIEPAGGDSTLQEQPAGEELPSFLKTLREEKASVHASALQAAANEEDEQEANSISGEELDKLQMKLEEQAKAQVEKVSAGKRSSAGGIFKKAFGSIVGAIAKQKEVLSSKPLRIGRADASQPPLASAGLQGIAGQATVQAGKDASSPQPHAPHFLTWRQKRDHDAVQRAKNEADKAVPPEPVAKAILEVSRQGEAATSAVESYAVVDEEEKRTGTAPVEARLDERMRQLKAMRRQFSAKPDYDHDGAAKKILQEIRKRRISTRKIELPKRGERKARKVERMLKKVEKKLAKATRPAGKAKPSARNAHNGRGKRG